MFKMLSMNVVQHSPEIYIVFANSRFAIRYMDSKIFAAIPRESQPGRAMGIYPKNMTTISYAHLIELSEKEKAIIVERIKAGLTAMDIKFEEVKLS